MQPFSVPVLPSCKHAFAPAPRLSQAPIAAFASGLLRCSAGLRWQVREAEGGAKPGRRRKRRFLRRSSSIRGCRIWI